MSYTGTVVVIPTRNRASIAMKAIRSVLDQPVQNLYLMVSDNSTSATEREALARFCSTLSDQRLRYIRPPESLSMPAHWDWAIQEALQSYPASHFLYLTDRMMFRNRALKELLPLAALYPDKVISYNQDRIVDNATPIRIDESPATERLLEVDTKRFSWLLSQAILFPGVPRMNNSIVPRAALVRIQQRFGNVFSSISPDFNFCCRCLEVEDSVLYYDKALTFHYALQRSNGASVSRGMVNVDYADFVANLASEESVTNFATPIPQLNTAINYVFHEYCLLKRQTNSNKFFDLDMQKYLQANANELSEVVDSALKAEMLALLVVNGYREATTNGQPAAAPVTFPKRLQSKIKRLLTAPATTSAWLFLARTLAIRPPGENRFEFATLDEAIYYAQNISRGDFSQRHRPEQLLNARELPKQ